MGLDIRLPLCHIFLIIGAIMTVYGLFAWDSPMCVLSTGMNLNVIWGGVMLVFGGIMLALSRKKA